MSAILPDSALDQLFRDARTFSYWLDRDVTLAQIEAIHALLKMAPTSANQQPGRFVWCKSQGAKERLAACASEGNRAKILSAPVTVIVAHDCDFHEQLPWLYPPADARSWFVDDDAARETSAFRNGTLQGAYLILAARSQGLDCGPMSGFDNGAVDREFLADQPQWKSNFICSIGYGDRTKLHERSPRPDFETFNRVI